MYSYDDYNRYEEEYYRDEEEDDIMDYIVNDLIDEYLAEN